MRQKFANKMAENCKCSYLQSNNIKIIQLVYMFFVFSEKALSSMISNINKVKELSAGISKAKNFSKISYKTHTFIFKFPKLLHLWTYLGVFLTWYTWPTQFRSKMWLTNNLNKWDKSKPKICKKCATFSYIFIIFVTFYHFHLTCNINKYLVFQTKHIDICNAFSNKIIVFFFDMFHFYVRLLDIPDTIRYNMDMQDQQDTRSQDKLSY